ncbi:MAG: ribonuclease H-like domain-containing protein [Holosporaceae bacterium]|jgi:ribonuclease D|nr:ribonuclease H-like domain-containing protein [Holosporaceae bacterium]
MNMNLHKNDLPADVRFSSSVAIDTETMGLVLKRDRLCLVQLCSPEGEVHLVQMEPDGYHEAENLRRLLVDKDVLKIFHFARFDVGILNHSLSIKVSPVYCTKIASKLARTYSDKHGLKNLCKEVLNVEISKHEQSSDWGNSSLSKEQLIYARGDVVHLHALKAKLDELLLREKRMSLAQKCFDAIELIVELDQFGLPPEELFQH